MSITETRIGTETWKIGAAVTVLTVEVLAALALLVVVLG